LEDGLASAMQIILKLGYELGQNPYLDQGSQRDKVEVDAMIEQIDELESIESLCDLLKFIREDQKSLLIRNPRIQKVVQNSFQLLRNGQPRADINSSESIQRKLPQEMNNFRADRSEQLKIFQMNSSDTNCNNVS
jgi:hypothetical protein